MPESLDAIRRVSRWRALAASPLGVLVLVLALVFAVEAAIMLVLTRGSPRADESLVVSLADAIVLAAVLAPALWFLVVRPLRALIGERGMLLLRVLDAQEEERERIARDLHDELGQQLTAVLLGLRAAESAESLHAARAGLQAARRGAADGLEAVRRLARGLSPVVLRDLGLETAVARLCEDMAAASGLTVTRELALPDERLAPEVEIAVYRIVQEALTNATRHARATHVHVRVVRVGDALHLGVRDDGVGLEGGLDGAPGLGMRGIRERVQSLGGVLHVASAPGRGTMVAAELPR
ncbi:MAG: sensor histidine kinase, partial [Phycisphaerae bacterium]